MAALAAVLDLPLRSYFFGVLIQKHSDMVRGESLIVIVLLAATCANRGGFISAAAQALLQLVGKSGEVGRVPPHDKERA